MNKRAVHFPRTLFKKQFCITIMKNILKKIHLFHPWLIGLFPLLQYYSLNKSEAFFSNLWVPLFLMLCAIALVWVLTKKIIKSSVKTSLLTSLLLLYFFSYGHVRNFFNIMIQKIPQLPLQKDVVFFIVYSVVAILLIKISLYIKNQEKLSGFLCIVGLYLFIIPLLSIIPSEIQRVYTRGNIEKYYDKNVREDLNKALQNTSAPRNQKESDTLPTDSQPQPDIYYIVPDRYANQHILEKYYNYDNSEFIGYLQDKGFYVADHSYANYPKTFLSLASTLNLQHITNLTDIIGKKSSDNTPIFTVVQNNLVSDFLQKKGYRFIYFGSWWEPTRINRHADENINLYANSDEFLRKFGQTTILNPIFAYIFKRGDILGFSDDRVRENHLYQIEKLKTIAQEPSPKFVFVHILAPHSPYVLDENCEAYSTKSDNKDDGEYVNQLRCINKSLKNIIDNILRQSNKPPVIILQSDEGPFKVDEMNKHGEGVDWTKVSDDAIVWHMKILNAFYFPESNYDELYQDISSVNTFRVVFNRYFETQFPMLEDKAYFIPHLNYPYAFTEVTDIVNVKE